MSTSKTIAEKLATYRNDPLGFVMFAFPWGQPGALVNKTGPEDWQRQVLIEIRDGMSPELALKIAVSSGHGVGKSALVSWIILWAISTCLETRGVITANTETQLRTKTWAEVAKWNGMFIGRDAFSLEGMSVRSKADGLRQTWRVDAISWSLNNTEGFAGLHNQGKRVLLVFDEASAIPSLIWEVSEGALTDADTEILWLAFGNPTQPAGRFFECFHKDRGAWVTHRVDSREVSLSNKAQIAKWADSYGDDSDFFRVRVKGEFPRAGSNQFIARHSAEAAVARSLEPDLAAAIVLGVDVARFGDDKTVILVRQGRKVIPPIVEMAEADTIEIAGRVVEIAGQYSADQIFVDGGGGYGGGVVDQIRALNWRCLEIQPGSEPQDKKRYFNHRAEMWGRMRDWLEGGDLPEDTSQLVDDLAGPEYGFDNKGRIQLEKKTDMKKRGLASPDYGDALALTFSQPRVARRQSAGRQYSANTEFRVHG